MPAWDDTDDKKLLLTIVALGLSEGGDKWGPIAARLPGKSTEAVRQRYYKLKRDFGTTDDAPSTPVATPSSSPGKRKRAPAGDSAKKKAGKGKGKTKAQESEDEDGLNDSGDGEGECKKTWVKQEPGVEAGAE